MKSFDDFLKSRSPIEAEKAYRKYLRCYYAGLAMQGICGHIYSSVGLDEKYNSRLLAAVADAVSIADALIEELDKRSMHQA